MVLSGRRGGGVLPPLLASSEDRKESGWAVAETPWHPDMIKAKGKQVLWYPDYLYAVDIGSLYRRLPKVNVSTLPDSELPNSIAYQQCGWRRLSRMTA